MSAIQINPESAGTPRPTTGGSLLQRLVPGPPEDLSDWVGDAQWSMQEQRPLRARRILWMAAAVVLSLLAWARVAEVDEVTRGEGRVIPSSQLQIAQAVDGGIIEDMLVHEGQVVTAGTILLRIDPTRFISNLRENRAEFLALTAKAARLQALTKGAPYEPPQEAIDRVPTIVTHQQRLYISSLEERDAQVAIAREQRDQRQREAQEARARRDQAKRGLELAAQELAVTRPLVSSGAVSEVEVLRLEREVSRLTGERDQAIARILRLQSAIIESERKIEEVELALRNQWENQLSDTLARLESLGESQTALADRVAQAEVRSPVRGTIKRVLVNTAGAVVQPGQPLVEIVPLDDALLLEARVQPRDIAFLRPNQKAVVKFTAYDFAIYGALDAVVEHISADSVIDEQGIAYFLIRVRTNEATLGEGLPIIPGMVAQVDVLTGKKTVLDYLLKPVLRAKAHALTER